MIDDALITRVFENIIENGKLVNVTDKELIFEVDRHPVTIRITNETKHDEEVNNTPLSIDKLIKWHTCSWMWSTHSAIKPGVLLVYHICTPHNSYIVKPRLSKQEEYKEKIDKLLYDYELDYLSKLLSI